jgi:hypothetical protein
MAAGVQVACRHPDVREEGFNSCRWPASVVYSVLMLPVVTMVLCQ